MRSEIEKKLAREWKLSDVSYTAISKKLGITRNSAINLCLYRPKLMLKKRGPKFKISKKEKLQIKRQICTFRERKEKVNSPKLKKSCNLSVSLRTIERHMKEREMKYRKIPKKIFLSNQHKQKRVEHIRKWICENHDWEHTIFTDEKRFTFDGPDDWRTYMYKNDQEYRVSRQCEGGGVMVWMMVLPNDLLSFKIVEGKFNSQDYIKLLKENIMPIIKLNYGNNFWFQEDNASVHKSKEVRNFVNVNGIKVLDWPAKSPDLNIVEDLWNILSKTIYDGPQFHRKADLTNSIKMAIDDFNSTKRHIVFDLYNSIRGRLCTVLSKHGNLYNK